MSDSDVVNTPIVELVPAPEPTPHEIAVAALKAIVSDTTVVVDKLYTFKGKKETVNGVVTKVDARKPVSLAVPQYSWDGFVKVLTNPALAPEVLSKLQALVLDGINSSIDAQVRSQISPTEPEIVPVTTQDQLRLNELDIVWLAPQPKGARGGGIASDIWDAFGEDYATTMVSNKLATQAQADAGAKVLVGKFATVKTNLPVITKLLTRLQLYVTESANAENFVDCIEFLNKKGQELLNADQAAMVEAV